MKLKISKTKKVAKGEVLLGFGKVATYAFKVETGCLKSYVIDSAGKEHILQFAPENWIISDMDSVTNKKPSVIFIEAIEDSEVSYLSVHDFEDLDTLDKDIVMLMAVKYRNNLIATNKRVIGLLSATAEQRYIEFTETYPSLVQRLSLKLIASYIGITPEYLSELRRKLSKK